MERIDFQVHGKVSGFRYSTETLEAAQARLALEAEMRGNSSGMVRIHIQVVGETKDVDFGAQVQQTNTRESD